MRTNDDPALERARDDAEGTEVFDRQASSAEGTMREAEEAQGVERFEDPDATLPAAAVAEGPAGAETLTAADPDWDSSDELRNGTS